MNERGERWMRRAFTIDCPHGHGTWPQYSAEQVRPHPEHVEYWCPYCETWWQPSPDHVAKLLRYLEGGGGM